MIDLIFIITYDARWLFILALLDPIVSSTAEVESCTGLRVTFRHWGWMGLMTLSFFSIGKRR